jgi:hypothetical protein
MRGSAYQHTPIAAPEMLDAMLAEIRGLLG